MFAGDAVYANDRLNVFCAFLAIGNAFSFNSVLRQKEPASDTLNVLQCNDQSSFQSHCELCMYCWKP